MNTHRKNYYCLKRDILLLHLFKLVAFSSGKFKIKKTNKGTKIGDKSSVILEKKTNSGKFIKAQFDLKKYY